MVDRLDTAVVRLWGDQVGAVSWLKDRGYAIFEYDPAFLKKGLDISPIHMGREQAASGDGLFSFPGLSRETFLGLPGLLADALPDKFGNNIIDTWLARNGRDPAGFSPVERLCYTGKRAMGALEFFPPVNRNLDQHVPVEIAELVDLTQKIMSRRLSLNVDIGPNEKENAEAIMDILRVGTSAGGARPKAVIAMNQASHIISGQGEVPDDYEYWLLKFDGVHDLELGAPKGYGRIEYAYYLMARSAGIDMAESRLLEENGRAHFLTRRFDRSSQGKIHMQSLCGLAHFDFNMAGAYSYEQVFTVMRKMRLSKADARQQYRRMAMNVMARNQDDHTKNISFLMNPEGQWKLSPAFDLIYAHNPAGKWTDQHQMTLNGKRDHFLLSDLVTLGESISISRPIEMIREVAAAVAEWPEYARAADVPEAVIREIGRNHRTDLIQKAREQKG